jgi:outer membrane usher protein
VLTIPIDRQTVSATSIQRNAQGLDTYTTVTHNPASDGELAWRALVARRDETRAEAGAYYAGSKGRLSADVSTTRSTTNVRLGAAGGLLLAGGHGFALQRFDNAAALVETPGYTDVGVGLGAQASTRTNAQGVALLSRLSPYTNNPIRLDPNDLPITAEVDSIEIDAVPGWRSVAGVTFPIRGGRAALLRIEFDDGEPAPAGAVVRIEGEDRPFYVARRGEAYLTGLQATNRLRLTWQGRSCVLPVTLDADKAQDIARVGPIRCAGVAR